MRSREEAPYKKKSFQNQGYVPETTSSTTTANVSFRNMVRGGGWQDVFPRYVK